MRYPIEEAAIVAAVFSVLARTLYVVRVGTRLRREQGSGPEPRTESRARWNRFRDTADALMNADGIAFLALVLLSAGTMDELRHPLLLELLGALLVVIGLTSKIAAHRVVGDEGYYWYNFFVAPDNQKFVRKGIYRYFRNPMYGLGNLHLLGLPLLFLSSLGLAVGIYYLVAIWAFHLAVERPHTQAAIKLKSSSVDRRESVAS